MVLYYGPVITSNYGSANQKRWPNDTGLHCGILCRKPPWPRARCTCPFWALATAPGQTFPAARDTCRMPGWDCLRFRRMRGWSNCISCSSTKPIPKYINWDVPTEAKWCLGHWGTETPLIGFISKMHDIEDTTICELGESSWFWSISSYSKRHWWPGGYSMVQFCFCWNNQFSRGAVGTLQPIGSDESESGSGSLEMFYAVSTYLYHWKHTAQA